MSNYYYYYYIIVIQVCDGFGFIIQLQFQQDFSDVEVYLIFVVQSSKFLTDDNIIVNHNNLFMVKLGRMNAVGVVVHAMYCQIPLILGDL